MKSIKRMLDDNAELGFKISASMTLTGIVSLSAMLTVPRANEVSIFQRENKPAVMRIYATGRDNVMVQDPENPSHYIPLSDYLKTIEDPGKRAAEKVSIRRAAKFYEK